MVQKWDIVIVGGGLAGYVAANYLAKTKMSVLLVEKSKEVGGRARTNKIHNQYFNLGPHAFYKKGKAASIVEELGIQLHGNSPQLGGVLVENDIEYAAPFTPSGLISTRLLNWQERIEWVTVMMKISKMETEKVAKLTFEQWVGQTAKSKKVQSLLYGLGRLATYCHAPEKASAKVILSHVKAVLGGVIYVDGGWQTIIDQLQNKAVISGVHVQTHTTVKQITPVNGHLKLTLSKDEEILAKYVICTTGPHELAKMVSEEVSLFADSTAVKGATLDVALSQLPNPKRLFAIGLSDPLYFAVHSNYARLSEDGKSAVLHVFKYHHPDEHIDSKKVQIELEQFLEMLQPGWQRYVITSRYIPQIIVNQRLPQVGDEYKLHRSKTELRGLYIAGDWASPHSILAEGAISSGKQAAEEIIQKEMR
ncbi:NAD(P)/FAD-dependent oxidoreductase [Sporosarcina sp. ACRSL]|uniref:phytoene desaturase family protein n=1 Tax=Sporosarcina sp. ACRSL TaxID=2918215 RepID=UPI001EF471B2|nr:NAD(P)/FAD-dependent oxidoreductase [Sporosarcina sp. ACRSL]MCG7345842.1 NAD(P)/FAD-dependent oxidoreductase [Sporosarcina sp. ACRSL]